LKKNGFNRFTSFKPFNPPDLVRGPFEWLKKQGDILFQSSRPTPLLAGMFEVKKRRDFWLLDYALSSNHIHLCSKTPAERDRAE
jgi:hypothetical protein